MGIFRREPNPLAPKIQPFSAHRGLTAAATKVNVNDKRQLEIIQKRRAAASWQEDAWEYYDLVGEIKYAFRLFSNVLSRIRLYAGYVTDDDEAPTPLTEIDDDLIDYHVKRAVSAAMRRVFAGGAQGEILRKAGTNLLVAGECYLVQLPPKMGVRDKEQWRILSVNELVMRNGKYFFKSSKTQREADMEPIPSAAFVGRIWVEHPDFSDEADSSMRAIVDLCDEMFLFSRAARATARSRLNAGALFVPDTLSVSADQVSSDPDAVDVDGNPIIPEADDDDDEFERELLDAMTTPISDESSAASVVPLLIRGPAEAGDKIKFIKFERSFDPQLAIRAERALERILQAIDLPKDIVTGLANIKYSNAVQIEDQLYKQHIEPMVLMICDAFRAVYLEPALRAAGIDPEVAERIVVWYDPTAIQTAPDKSTAANVGFDKMALSFDAWRRANGFVDSDAPSNEEVGQRIAIQRGQLNDVMTEALFRTLFPEVLDAARQQSIANSPAPLPGDVQQLLGPGAQQPPVDPGAQQPPPAPGAPTPQANPNEPVLAPPTA